ncbi:MAG: thiamine diphosphokinase [Clostridia bacterium]|nr:thiamine diphosphokinase [Clostridia bacterium]
MDKYTNAVIIAAAPVAKTEYKKREGDLVIAADRGYAFASEKGIKCDLVIGDFDSLGSVPSHDFLERLPVEKDDTDTAYAIKRALALGAKRIFIIGGLGGRLDHTLANIQMLTYIARQGAEGFLINGDEILFVIKDQKVRLCVSKKTPVSVFSLSESSDGVVEKGFKYTLDGAVLESGFPLGVSNETADECAEISVKNGELLICVNTDSTNFIEKNRLDASASEINLNF